jgi:Tfp pilus assembly pilus retraction ATPase PilT
MNDTVANLHVPTQSAGAASVALPAMQSAELSASPQLSVTDLALSVDDASKSYCFPGPSAIPAGLRDYCHALLGRCKAVMNDSPGRDDFSVSHQDVVWRVHFDKRAIDGEWFRLRRMPKNAPHLGDNGMPSKLPASIRNVLLHPDLRHGGIVYVCGAAGSGKTTTAAAIVRSRLERFGGMAYTVEDPPEHPLNGWHHGKNGVAGICAQTMVNTAGQNAAGWAESMMGALRSQPAGTPSMLFVGEVRTEAAADVAIQAAGNGFLVIVTGFATDVTSGIDALIKLLRGRCQSLAHLLRVVVYQKLVESGDSLILNAQICVSPSSNSRMATIIASGQTLRLADEVMRQSHAIRTDQDLWKAAGGGSGE